MRADPKPDDRLVLQDAHGPIALAHADGVDWLGLVNPLEAKTGVTGIAPEQPIGLPGLALNVGRQLGEALVEALWCGGTSQPVGVERLSLADQILCESLPSEIGELPL